MTARKVLGAALTLLLLAGAVIGGYLYWRVTRFDTLIRAVAAEYDLDFHLVKSLVHEESWYAPTVRGRHGEVGLMQVMPVVEMEFKSARGNSDRPRPNLLDPTDNLRVGCWYLRQSLDRFREYSEPLPLALARYNAGESRVKNWIRAAPKMDADSRQISEANFLQAIDIESTREYVQRVLKRYRTRSVFFLF